MEDPHMFPTPTENTISDVGLTTDTSFIFECDNMIDSETDDDDLSDFEEFDVEPHDIVAVLSENVLIKHNSEHNGGDFISVIGVDKDIDEVDTENDQAYQKMDDIDLTEDNIEEECMSNMSDETPSERMELDNYVEFNVIPDDNVSSTTQNYTKPIRAITNVSEEVLGNVDLYNTLVVDHTYGKGKEDNNPEKSADICIVMRDFIDSNIVRHPTDTNSAEAHVFKKDQMAVIDECESKECTGTMEKTKPIAEVFNTFRPEPNDALRIYTHAAEEKENLVQTGVLSGNISPFYVINNETFKIEYESQADVPDTATYNDGGIDDTGKTVFYEEIVDQTIQRDSALIRNMKETDSSTKLFTMTSRSMLQSGLGTTGEGCTENSRQYHNSSTRTQQVRTPDSNHMYRYVDSNFQVVELFFCLLDRFNPQSQLEMIMTGMFVKEINAKCVNGDESNELSDCYYARKYICTNKHNGILCNREFSSSLCFLNHCLCKYSRGIYMCPVCGSNMRLRDKLDIHLKGHHIWLHTCDRCNHGFADKETLEYHRNCCSSTKRSGISQYSQHVCETCNEMHTLPPGMYEAANLDDAILPYLSDDSQHESYKNESTTHESVQREILICDPDYCQTDELQCLPTEDQNDTCDDHSIDVDAYVDVTDQTEFSEQTFIQKAKLTAQTDREITKATFIPCRAPTTELNVVVPDSVAYVKHINPGLADHRYMCSECESMFDLFNCCKSHIVECHNYSGYSCLVCGFKTNKILDLTSHLIYHDIWIYTCRFCQYGFSTAIEKASHESTCQSAQKGTINRTGPSKYFSHVCTTCNRLHKIGCSISPITIDVLRQRYPYRDHSYMLSPHILKMPPQTDYRDKELTNIKNKIVCLKLEYTRSGCIVSIRYLKMETKGPNHTDGVKIRIGDTGQVLAQHSSRFTLLTRSINGKNSASSLVQSDTSRKLKKKKGIKPPPNACSKSKRIVPPSRLVKGNNTKADNRPSICEEYDDHLSEWCDDYDDLAQETCEYDHAALTSDWCEMSTSCSSCSDFNLNRRPSLSWCNMASNCDLCTPPIKTVVKLDTVTTQRPRTGDVTKKATKIQPSLIAQPPSQTKTSQWIVVRHNNTSTKEHRSRTCVHISERELKLLLSEDVLGEIEYKQNSQHDSVIRMPAVSVRLDDISPYLDNRCGMIMSGQVHANTADNYIRMGQFYICNLCGCNFKIEDCFLSHLRKYHALKPQIRVLDGFFVRLYSCSFCSLVFDSLEEMLDERCHANCQCVPGTESECCSVCHEYHLLVPKSMQ